VSYLTCVHAVGLGQLLQRPELFGPDFKYRSLVHTPFVYLLQNCMPALLAFNDFSAAIQNVASTSRNITQAPTVATFELQGTVVRHLQ